MLKETPIEREVAMEVGSSLADIWNAIQKYIHEEIRLILDKEYGLLSVREKRIAAEYGLTPTVQEPRARRRRQSNRSQEGRRRQCKYEEFKRIFEDGESLTIGEAARILRINRNAAASHIQRHPEDFVRIEDSPLRYRLRSRVRHAA